jgi:bifunctional ADP-heptose synthase (sugar kinase/adenylyltransferase)
VFAKGGDYTGASLDEMTVVRRHGGVVVTLPTVPGRSTSALAAAGAGHHWSEELL